MRKDDLSGDQLLDMLLTYFKHHDEITSSKFNGYAQKVSLIPLNIQCYTYLQMFVLKQLVNLNEPVVLIGDATGTCVSSLPEPFRGMDPLIYTFIVKSRKVGGVPLPIAEMISNDHSHSTIAFFLHSYFSQ